MERAKGVWVQPQLIVLGRGTPEENVLAGCKTSLIAGRLATVKSCKKKLKNNCSSTKCSVISKTS
jgi:hypothetical protein